MALPEQTREMAFEEFEAFTALPENSERQFELIDGEVVEKMPTSFNSSEIAAEIVFWLKDYIRKQPIARVTGADGTYRMDANSAYSPDAGLVLKTSMPERPARLAPVPPDLAVEVLSPTDSKRQLRRKAERYLELGSKLVWLVFPEEQRVEVYVADKDVLELGIDDTLDGGGLLPEFSLPIREIFPK